MKGERYDMAKGNLFKAILGIGGAVAAVLVTRKVRRDKLKAEYNKYKQDPQSYKDNAKDKATQLGTIANETIKEVKTNPKEYANRLKNNPKAFFEENQNLPNMTIRMTKVLKKVNLMMKVAQHQIIIYVSSLKKI